MEPFPKSSLSFRPAVDGPLNPLLLPIQLPYLLVDRIITRVESVLQLTAADRVRGGLGGRRWGSVGCDCSCWVVGCHRGPACARALPSRMHSVRYSESNSIAQ